MAIDFSEPTFAHPDKNAAIDKHPSIANLDIPLTQAIALMGSRQISCGLKASDSESEQAFSSASRSGCVLILDGDRLVGIVTERDEVLFRAKTLRRTRLQVLIL